MADKAPEEPKEVEFPRPEKYDPPTTARDGEEFTVLATFRIDEDEPDKICLLKIEGVPINPDDEEEDYEGPQTSPEVMRALQQSEATNSSQGQPAASTY